MTIEQMLYVEWAVSRALRRRLTPPETLLEAALRMRAKGDERIRKIAELTLDVTCPPWERLREAAIIAEPVLRGARGPKPISQEAARASRLTRGGRGS